MLLKITLLLTLSSTFFGLAVPEEPKNDEKYRVAPNETQLNQITKDTQANSTPVIAPKARPHATSTGQLGNQHQQEGHRIEFKIKNIPDHSKIQLAYHYGKKKLLQDTTLVLNNQFVFEGSEPLKRGLYLVVIPEKGYFELAITEDQHFSVQTSTEDFVSNMKITGHNENAAFYDYMNATAELNRDLRSKSESYNTDSCGKATEGEPSYSACSSRRDAIIALNNELEKAKLDYTSKHPDFLTSKMFRAIKEVDVPLFEHETDPTKQRLLRFNYYHDHYFDNIDFSESGLIRTPIFEDRIHKFLDDLVYKVCDSARVSADRLLSMSNDQEMFKYLLTTVTNQYENSKVMCMDCMKLHLFQKYYIGDQRVDWISEDNEQKIKEEIWKMEHNQCGKVPYPLTKTDLKGKGYDLMTVDAEYTIMFFWSATCGHCKKAMPKLRDMYNRIHDEYDVEIYSVCIDEDKEPFKKFCEENQIQWKYNLVDDGTDKKYRTAYNVFSTPTVYLLNNKKEIIAKKVDVETLEKMISELASK